MNGLHIKISQDEFMEKTEPERSWMLFEAVSKVDAEGCKWAQEGYKVKFRNVYLIVGVAGVLGGFLAMVAKWVGIG